MLLVVFYLFVHITFIRSDDKIITTTESNDVCDIDNSCNTTIATEITTDKVNLTDKWKYNVTEAGVGNDTIINIFHLNDTSSNTTAESNNKQNNHSLVNPENKSTNTKYQINFSDNCECDMTRGSCDMNCCCDRDCLHVNRDVFKNCIGVKSTEEDKYCPTKILNSPLLCVVKDNLYSRHFYPHHRIAEETSNVNKLLKNREIYGWSFPAVPTEEPEIGPNFEQYESSSPILIHNGESNVQSFQLPKSTIVSRDCSNKGVMKFLEDFEEVCTHRVRNASAAECSGISSAFNANNYFKNFSFVSNPSLMNSTLNCSQNCINVTSFICETDDLLTCLKTNSSTKLTSFTPSTNTCHQAVTSTHYSIHHNGTEGITSVALYLQLSDIVLRENLLWALKVKLSYQWVGQGSSFQLSGNPGYVMEKPIITGYKVYQASKDNKTTHSMKMSYNRYDWLTLFGTKSDGSCLKLHRENIKFQENLYSHCFFNLPLMKTVDSCEVLQYEIFEIIFGPNINLSNIFVSTIGNPDTTDKKKWAPILFDLPSNVLNDTCHGLVTSVKMVILHSTVGDYENPQQIIMGVKVTGQSFNGNILRRNKIKISFSINFYDVTNPPLRIFAEPPTYEIKLPTDFFYPFFSSSVVPRVSTELVSVLISILFYMR